MTQLRVDGFALYGTGDVNQYPFGGPITQEAVGIAMLSGVWAEVANACDSTGKALIANPTLNKLPWAPDDTDLYVSRSVGTYNNAEMTYATSTSYRVVLPTTADPVLASLYYAVSYLPPTEAAICAFCDATNAPIAWLFLTSAGGLQLRNADAATVLAQTTGPVIVAETATHLEMKLSVALGQFQINVNGTAAITATGLVFTNTNPTAQIRYLPAKYYNISTFLPVQYVGNLILRDTTGSFNNTFAGDRRVATLMVNSDDPAHQGWKNHPLLKFGPGVADLTAGVASRIEWTEKVANSFKIGASDFTLEGQFRFKALPGGSTRTPLIHQWTDLVTTGKDWILALGSQSYNGGQLFFKATTDGTATTETTLFSYPWQPVLDQWYHVAVNRTAGVLQVFIDGKQLGPAVIDGLTYAYTGTKSVWLGGASPSGSGNLSNVFMWVDDVRVTIGAGRYTTNFVPPTAALPIGSPADPLWANVQLRATFDDLSATDYSATGHLGSFEFLAGAAQPQDGVYNFQSMSQNTPNDGTFLSADLVAAQGNLTFTGVPANGDTVTCGTKDGITAATYTFKTALAAAYDVLIGTDAATCAANLVAAINAGAGAGTVYGTGTLANNDLAAYAEPGAIVNVVANVPGSAGNSFSLLKSGVSFSWDGTHMQGGVNIPAYSQFGKQRLPQNATLVDSVTLAARMWKTDAGTATVQNGLVGVHGGVALGGVHSVSTAPTVYLDTFETDPDNNTAPLSPAVVTQALLRLNRAS